MEPLAELREGERPEKTYKLVYTIVEKGPNRKYWLRVGIAFPNRDGSMTVRLDASPTNGQLHIRDPEPYAPRVEGAGAGNGGVGGSAGRSFESALPSVSDWLNEGGAR